MLVTPELVHLSGRSAEHPDTPVSHLSSSMVGLQDVRKEALMQEFILTHAESGSAGIMA